MLLMGRDVRLDLNIDVAVQSAEAAEPRDQQFTGKEWRYLQAHHRATEAPLELLRHRLESREHRIDVLEILRTRGTQRQGARSAVEQRDAELLLQRLDLMAHGRRRHTQLLRGGLEA